MLYVEMYQNLCMLYDELVQINMLHVHYNYKNFALSSSHLAVSTRFIRQVFQDPLILQIYQSNIQSILHKYIQYNLKFLHATTYTELIQKSDQCDKLMKIHTYVELVYQYHLLINWTTGENTYISFLKKVALVMSKIYNIPCKLINENFISTHSHISHGIMIDQQELLLLTSSQ